MESTILHLPYSFLLRLLPAAGRLLFLLLNKAHSYSASDFS